MPDIFVAGPARKNKPLTQGREGMGERYETVAERMLKQRRLGRFRAFNVLPNRVRFENQEHREKIILMLRQHWITQLGWIMAAVAGVFVPLIFVWIPILDFLKPNYQLMSLIGWYLLLIAFIYEKFISWFYQVFIITDERIIDINFINLVYKELSEAKIDNIEDVTYRQGGVVKAMFNFGDVVIQTAGEQREFMVESAPEPNRVVKIINELKLEEEHEKMIGKVR